MKITAFTIIIAAFFAIAAAVWFSQPGGTKGSTAKDANDGVSTELRVQGSGVKAAKPGSASLVAEKKDDMGRGRLPQSNSPKIDSEGGHVSNKARSGSDVSGAGEISGTHKDPRKGGSGMKDGGQTDSGEENAGRSEGARQEVAAPPVGIRLGSDVRLPAAAMPIDFEMSPVAEKVLRTIVEDYYRDLATGMVEDVESVRNGDGNEEIVVETTEDGEKTVIVGNGGIAEEARKRADQRFKALFGNAAYNRLTMHSAMERMLPTEQR